MFVVFHKQQEKKCETIIPKHPHKCKKHSAHQKGGLSFCFRSKVQCIKVLSVEPTAPRASVQHRGRTTDVQNNELESQKRLNNILSTLKRGIYNVF